MWIVLCFQYILSSCRIEGIFTQNRVLVTFIVICFWSMRQYTISIPCLRDPVMLSCTDSYFHVFQFEACLIYYRSCIYYCFKWEHYRVFSSLCSSRKYRILSISVSQSTNICRKFQNTRSHFTRVFTVGLYIIVDMEMTYTT